MRCDERARLRERGQSTVEYAIVLAAFLAMFLGLGALGNLLGGGVVIDHALSTASHNVMGVASGVLGDAFLV